MALLVCLLCCSYSYSEIIIGQSDNASAKGLNWAMTEILPQFTGLTVNSVTYSYTAVKERADPFVVNVQNLNALGNGYVFRSRDDWSGLAGNTITKSVPVDSISIKYWGRGEIATEGQGLVLNPTVRYGFTYDTCSNTPVTDPKCPGYKPPVSQTSGSDPNDDEYVKQVLGTKYVAGEIEEEEKLRELLKPGVTPPRRTIVMTKPVQAALLTAEAAANAAAFEALNNIPNINQYTDKELFGGIYPETLKYVSKALQDNPRGRRLNMSQQILHNSLTDMQYINSKRLLND